MKQADQYETLDISGFTVTSCMMHVIEDEDIQTEKDVERLCLRLFNYPEHGFYYFHDSGKPVNALLRAAESANCLLMGESDPFYYKNPKYIKDFDRIPEGVVTYEWQEPLVENGPMHRRVTLKLSEQMKRRLEIRENINTEKASDTNPLLLKPSLWGFGIDIPKAIRWLRSRLWRADAG
jgi:hypothetical protein